MTGGRKKAVDMVAFQLRNAPAGCCWRRDTRGEVDIGGRAFVCLDSQRTDDFWEVVYDKNPSEESVDINSLQYDTIYDSTSYCTAALRHCR